MRIKNIFIVFALISIQISAQPVKVIENRMISITDLNSAYYPFFNSDDSKILFSKNNYENLYSVDLKSNRVKVIATGFGAGYKPLLLDDDRIVFRSHTITNGRKFQSVFEHNLNTDNTNLIEKDIRLLKLPSQNRSKNLILIKDQEIIEKPIKNTLAKVNIPDRAVYVENNNLYQITDGKKITMNPLGKGVYVWESISNDNQMILFTFGNKGAFICDTAGNIIDNIAYAHYPRFSPNGKYISYMIDKDDGTNIISSDIYIYSIDLKQSFPITNTIDQIEMFAEWSNDGKKLVYNTLDGHLFVSTLQLEN